MKIMFVNVPWMKYYTGEGDEEKAAPLAGYIFQNVNGFYYGYSSGLDTIAIENIEGTSPNDEKAEDVLVIWTAKNEAEENKIIGWYKKATVYKEAKSKLTLDSDRIVLQYSITAKSEDAVLLPPELRLFGTENKEQEIWFEENIEVIKAVAMYTHNYGGEKFNELLNKKDLSAESVLNFPEYEDYLMKADEFLAKDLYGKAIRCFNKAITLWPEYAMGYACKGSVLLSLKMYDEALESYQKVIELDEKDEEALYCIGLLYGLKENYESCIKYLSQYIKDNPRDVYALAERGIACYNMGDAESAKTDFARAYQMESDNPVLHKLIQYVNNKQ